jgi:lysine 2,3-aminomutase
MRTSGASETDSEESDKPPSIRTVYPSNASPQITRKTILPIGAPTPEKVVRFAEARRESFPVGKQARAFQKQFFPETSAADWSDWRWQLRSRIKNLAMLERAFTLSADERDAIERHKGSLPVGITPYYASLLDRENPEDGLRRTHIPVGQEYLRAPGEARARTNRNVSKPNG